MLQSQINLQESISKLGLGILCRPISINQEGYIAILAFVIAMPKVSMVYPNVETHKAFGDALEEARQAGVKILYLPCTVTKEGMWISS